MIALTTQVEGKVLFFEKMFKSRLYLVERLIAMDGHAVASNPHRVTRPSNWIHSMGSSLLV